MRDVRQGPQSLVRKAVVVPFFLFLREPESLQGVFGTSGRNENHSISIGGLPVGGSRTVRDPKTRACPNDGLDRRDESARRKDRFDLRTLTVVDIGLAVGNHADFGLSETLS